MKNLEARLLQHIDYSFEDYKNEFHELTEKIHNQNTLYKLFDNYKYNLLLMYPFDYYGCQEYLYENLLSSTSPIFLKKKLMKLNSVLSVNVYNVDNECAVNANVLITGDILDKNEFQEIKNILNTCNYFICSDDSITDTIHQILVEARYQIEEVTDIIYNGCDGILYHITDKKYLNKIKQNGLCPKHKNKKVWHPSRIYFTIDEDETELLKKLLYTDGSSIVLKIDLKKNLHQIRIFRDPATPYTGCFTYENISPTCISLIN